MDLPEITKFPVLIISTPRTGSSVLATIIGEKYDLRVFIEPHESQSHLHGFIEYAQDNKDYLLKIHSRDVDKYPSAILQELYSDSSFKINTERRDRASQIASAIVAHARNTWAYRVDDYEAPNDEIHFTKALIDLNINYFKKCYVDTDNLQLHFDYVVDYDDLGYIEHRNHVKTPVPSNYQELLTAIRSRI